MYGIGIIGCGKIAQIRHIPEYAEHPACELRAFYNPTVSRAEAMAEKYGGAVFQDAESLIACPDVDVISVCCSNKWHAKMAIDALNAGKHVICEKPMAVSPEECEAMCHAARQNGRRLFVAMNQRLYPGHKKARELIAEGRIGTPISFHSCFGHSGPENWAIQPGNDTWFFRKDQAVMGVMADLGIHKTDLLRYLLQEEITSVTASIKVLDKKDASGEPIGVEDYATCIFETSGGTVGTMTVSWSYYGREDNSTVIYGTEGILRICDDDRAPLILHRKNRTEQRFELEEFSTNDHQERSGVIEECISSIQENRPSILDAEDIMKSHRVVFAAMESGNKQSRIQLEP